MNKLYAKNDLYFALLWIVIYCAVTAPLREAFGDDSLWMVGELLIVALILTLFVKRNHLAEKIGLRPFPKDGKRYLYFIPMWFLATGNLWGGVEPVYSGWNQLVAVSTMLLIGYVEEFIFRGLLFSAMLSRYDDRKAIIISSITFGIGHIVNLLTGQLAPETFIQVIFAVAWGFILTMVVYRSKSLWPAIVAHGLVDAFSVFSREQAAPSLLATWIYPLVTIAVALVYCSYLSKLKPREPWDKERLRP